MSNNTQTKPVKKSADTVKRLLADKKAIHLAIKSGEDASRLKAKGIRFVSPL